MTSRLIGFRSKKAAQLAAYFTQLNEGRIDKMKLIKLIYLAEREFLGRYGQPMLYDEFYSLPHGPICSSALDGISGKLGDGHWAHYLGRKGIEVFSVSPVDRNDLDELSNAEISIASNVYESFGWMTASVIRRYTHNNCPEYTEVKNGRLPISYKEVMTVLGVPEADRLADEINETRRVDRLLST